MTCVDSGQTHTYCTIQFIDDGVIEDVVIANYDYDENDDSQRLNDDKIFFYGISPDHLRNACASGEVLEDEWKVLNIEEVIYFET